MKTLPALKAAFALSSGIVLAYWSLFPFAFIIASFVFLLLLGFIPFSAKVKDLLAYLLLLTTGAAGIASYESSSIPTETKLYLRCRVEEPPLFRDNLFSFPARILKAGVDSSNLEDFKGTIWVKGKGKTQPQLGSMLEMSGVLKPFKERRNPGDFNLKRWRAGEGIIGEFSCKSMREVHNNAEVPLIISIRKWLSGSCDRLARADAPLWKGLILGFRRDIDPILMEELRVTGLTHLLALSGLNVGFLALAFIGLGALLRMNINARIAFALVLVCIYAQIIPDRGSTLRATVMTVVFMLGYLFHKWTPKLNTIGLACLIILALRPLDLFDPGFGMSFAATTGIFMFDKDISRLNDWRRRNSGKIFRFMRHRILVPIAYSLAASIFVAPFTSYYFSSIALAGPFANVIAVPLMGLVYAGVWLAVISQPFGGWVSQLLSDGVLVISQIWKLTTHIMATMAPDWRITLPPWAILIILCMLVLASLSNSKFRVKLFILTLGLAAILSFSISTINSSRFRALFLDVGHGDAQIWLFPDGSTCLIDAGPSSNRLEGIVEQVLHRLNRRELLLAVASHPDADHIGGFPEIIEEFDISTAVTNEYSKSTETFRNLAKISSERHVVWRQLSAIDSINGLPDKAELEILNPPDIDPGWSDNDLSLVLRLRVPDGNGSYQSLLTVGDIETAAEHYLISHHNPKSDLLKIAHHGSATSSSVEFIEAVQPKLGIISRGWGDERVSVKAREEVLRRYEEVGAKLLFTDKTGAVLIEATPYGWQEVNWRHPGFGNWLLGRL